MDQKWSPVQVLGKYFEANGQNSPITPEVGKKRLLLCWDGLQSTFLDGELSLDIAFRNNWFEVYDVTLKIIFSWF